MTLALSGAHAVGKSTLAEAVSNKFKWPVVSSKASDIFKKLDLPYTGLSFENRLRVQNAILDQHIADVSAIGCKSFVSDRSTIDMAAYMMCEWGMTAQGEQITQLMQYVDRCMQAAGRLYSTILQIRPGIEYEVSEKRPAPSASYQAMMDAQLFAMMHDPRIMSQTASMPATLIDLDERVTSVSAMWSDFVRTNVQVSQAVARH